jgi:site-specific recombinase XerD
MESLSDLAYSWERSLRAADKAPGTVVIYRRAVAQYVAWLEAREHGDDVENLTRPLIQDWLAGLAATRAPATHLIRHAGLHLFCRWLEGERIISADPMAGMKQPVVRPTRVPVLPDDDLAALFATCAGPTFRERRDLAMLRVLFDCGLRIAELTNLQVTDVDLKHDEMEVLGKGRKPRVVPFGSNTGLALDRYKRMRAKHRLVDSPALWLGGKGPLKVVGVSAMIRRRAVKAGLDGLHAHQLRHTFAHRWLADGGQERDLMRLAGWSSESMLSRYGASAADERAAAAFRRMRLGDRL